MVEGGVIHSTDAVIESKYDYNKFFSDMKENNNFAPLSRVHSENLNNAKKSIDEGITPIIIDNTNIKANECKEYVEYALNVGYANENIKFIEVGTSDLLAEELAERNTHGVPLGKIESMILSYESVGPLDLDKVIKSKPMYKKKVKKIAMAVLDDKSRAKLLGSVSHFIPKDWEMIAHHMTINFGKGLGDRIGDLGKNVTLVAEEIGVSNMAVAVKVSGYHSDNNIPHITIAVNRKNGGKPVMSNMITEWKPLVSKINLNCEIVENKLN